MLRIFFNFLRLKSSSKSLIEHAAGFEGKTVSHFILTSALEQAEKTVQMHETMALKAKNSKIFFEALAAPVRFNRKLAAAFEEHDQRVVSKYLKIWLESCLSIQCPPLLSADLRLAMLLRDKGLGKCC